MDGLFNKGKEMLTKSGKTGEPAAGNAPAAGAGGQPAAGAGGQDYGDKGMFSPSLYLTYLNITPLSHLLTVWAVHGYDIDYAE